MLRTYETLFIVKPDATDEEVTSITKTIEALITNNGGTIETTEIWGKRRLAYKVRKHVEGYYVLIRFQAPATIVVQLQSHFRLAESVIRHLVKYFDERELRLEALQKKRREAELHGPRGMARRVDDQDEEQAVGVGARRRRGDMDLDDEEKDEE